MSVSYLSLRDVSQVYVERGVLSGEVSKSSRNNLGFCKMYAIIKKCIRLNISEMYDKLQFPKSELILIH